MPLNLSILLYYGTMAKKKEVQLFDDKTEYFILAIREFILNEATSTAKINYYRLIGEIEFLLKTRFVEQSNITQAAIRLALKRSSLAEYLRKIDYKKGGLENGS